jgi:RND superfamily putative drug exporter
MVQNITTPLGIPIQQLDSVPDEHQGQTSNMNLLFQRDQLANQLKTIDRRERLDRHLGEAYQLPRATKLTGLGGKSQALLETPKNYGQHRELR